MELIMKAASSKLDKSRVFTNWLNHFNRNMARADRNILLLMDNAASHASAEDEVQRELYGPKTIELSNITNLFLPPNTTSKIQPLDAGIIAAFKAHYSAFLVS